MATEDLIQNSFENKNIDTFDERNGNNFYDVFVQNFKRVIQRLSDTPTQDATQEKPKLKSIASESALNTRSSRMFGDQYQRKSSVYQGIMRSRSHVINRILTDHERVPSTVFRGQKNLRRTITDVKAESGAKDAAFFLLAEHELLTAARLDIRQTLRSGSSSDLVKTTSDEVVVRISNVTSEESGQEVLLCEMKQMEPGKNNIPHPPRRLNSVEPTLSPSQPNSVVPTLSPSQPNSVDPTPLTNTNSAGSQDQNNVQQTSIQAISRALPNDPNDISTPPVIQSDPYMRRSPSIPINHYIPSDPTDLRRSASSPHLTATELIYPSGNHQTLPLQRQNSSSIFLTTMSELEIINRAATVIQVAIRRYLAKKHENLQIIQSINETRHNSVTLESPETSSCEERKRRASILSLKKRFNAGIEYFRSNQTIDVSDSESYLLLMLNGNFSNIEPLKDITYPRTAVILPGVNYLNLFDQTKRRLLYGNEGSLSSISYLNGEREKKNRLPLSSDLKLNANFINMVIPQLFINYTPIRFGLMSSIYGRRLTGSGQGYEFRNQKLDTLSDNDENGIIISESINESKSQHVHKSSSPLRKSPINTVNDASDGLGLFSNQIWEMSIENTVNVESVLQIFPSFSYKTRNQQPVTGLWWNTSHVTIPTIPEDEAIEVQSVTPPDWHASDRSISSLSIELEFEYEEKSSTSEVDGVQHPSVQVYDKTVSKSLVDGTDLLTTMGSVGNLGVKSGLSWLIDFDVSEHAMRNSSPYIDIQAEMEIVENDDYSLQVLSEVSCPDTDHESNISSVGVSGDKTDSSECEEDAEMPKHFNMMEGKALMSRCLISQPDRKVKMITIVPGVSRNILELCGTRLNETDDETSYSLSCCDALIHAATSQSLKMREDGKIRLSDHANSIEDDEDEEDDEMEKAKQLDHVEYKEWKVNTLCYEDLSEDSDEIDSDESSIALLSNAIESGINLACVKKLSSSQEIDIPNVKCTNDFQSEGPGDGNDVDEDGQDLVDLSGLPKTFQQTDHGKSDKIDSRPSTEGDYYKKDKPLKMDANSMTYTDNCVRITSGLSNGKPFQLVVRDLHTATKESNNEGLKETAEIKENDEQSQFKQLVEEFRTSMASNSLNLQSLDAIKPLFDRLLDEAATVHDLEQTVSTMNGLGSVVPNLVSPTMPDSSNTSDLVESTMLLDGDESHTLRELRKRCSKIETQSEENFIGNFDNVKWKFVMKDHLDAKYKIMSNKVNYQSAFAVSWDDNSSNNGFIIVYLSLFFFSLIFFFLVFFLLIRVNFESLPSMVG